MLNKPTTLSHCFFSCSLVFLPVFLNYPVFPAEHQTTQNATATTVPVSETKNDGTPKHGYATICLNNCLGQQVTYFLRWGSGQWQQFYLNGNSYQTHYNVYELSAEIYFDSDFSSINKILNYTLYHNDASDTHCEHAKQYHFDWSDSDGCFDLNNGSCH